MPKNMTLPLVVLLTLLAGSTYLQGRYSERWGRSSSERLGRLAKNVETAVPLVIGEWQGTDQPLDPVQFEASNCDAAREIKYQNRANGDTVVAYVVAGNARNVTIHTPERCYTGAGFEMEGEKEIYTHTFEPYGGGPPQSIEFMTATFRKEEPQQITRLRIFWTFSDNGNWISPKVEKVSLAYKKYLAKVYLITPIPVQGDEVTESPSLELAEELFPSLNQMLFGNLDAEAS